MPNYIVDNKALVREWNYKKNKDIDINKITSGSHKKVWWICSKHPEWETDVSSRYKGHGCPYCNNLRALAGYNDLATLNPNLAKEWNYEKNGILKPSDVLPGSYKKVWWKCKNGHEWEKEIKDRNSGLGQQLMEKMENYFKSIDCEYVVIDVFAYNNLAINFYNKQGYHTRGLIDIKKL